jgi:hypothetical protein
MKAFLTGLGIGLGVAAVVAVLAFALREEGDGADSPVVSQADPQTAVQADPQTAPQAPPAAEEDASVSGLARAYCEVERRDPDDFARQYGSGEAAMEACIARETTAAERECDRDRAGDPDDFRREFGGSDAAAIERCIKYELRSF